MKWVHWLWVSPVSVAAGALAFVIFPPLVGLFLPWPAELLCKITAPIAATAFVAWWLWDYLRRAR